MSNAPRKMMVVALICAVLFAAGLARLFWLRFEAGDVYPPYASLRGDPLGTQVLYESLNRMRQNGAQRNYRPLNQVDVATDQTWLVIGLPGNDEFLHYNGWEKLLERIALDGGRLVISFTNSARQRLSRPDECGGDDDENAPQAPEEGCTDEDGQSRDRAVPEEEDHEPMSREGGSRDSHASWKGVSATLGITLKPFRDEMRDDSAQRTAAAPDALPALIPWRSPLYFDLEDSAWQPLYQTDGEPVIAVRPWGAGSIVMAADSYLFSNEALRGDRFSGLLTWFVQPPHRVVIDEFHNGLIKNPGIADLMRKYRLHGLLVSLGVLLVLLLWRQTAVFVTRPGETVRAAHDVEAGSDTAEGLVGLMQQHIHADELLRVCYAAWHTSSAAGRVSGQRMTLIEQVVADFGGNPRRKDIVNAYQQICELLKQGNLP